MNSHFFINGKLFLQKDYEEKNKQNTMIDGINEGEEEEASHYWKCFLLIFPIFLPFSKKEYRRHIVEILRENVVGNDEYYLSTIFSFQKKNRKKKACNSLLPFSSAPTFRISNFCS